MTAEPTNAVSTNTCFVIPKPLPYRRQPSVYLRVIFCYYSHYLCSQCRHFFTRQTRERHAKITRKMYDEIVHSEFTAPSNLHPILHPRSQALLAACVAVSPGTTDAWDKSNAEAMDNLHVRLTFNLAKTNKIFYYS